MLFGVWGWRRNVATVAVSVFACFPLAGRCDTQNPAEYLRLELVSDGSDRVEVRVVNVGKKVVHVVNLFVVPNNMLNFIIKDENNNTVPYSGPVAKLDFDESYLVRLGAGYFVGTQKQLRDLRNFRDIKNGFYLQKGTYRVTAVYTVSSGLFPGRDVWSGTIRSNEIIITVD